MKSGFNGTQQIIDIPADTNAFLAILATGPCRRITVEESPLTAAGAANTLVGLIQYQIPNDTTATGFTTVFEAIGANDSTAQGEVTVAGFMLGDNPGDIGSFGSILGNGPGNIIGIGPTAAATLCKVRSGGAATSVVVRQDY